MDNEVDPPLAEGLLKPYLELDLVVKARLFGRGFHVEVDVATAAVIVNPASKQADLRVEGGDEDLAFTALEGVCDLAGELQREPLMHHAQRQWHQDAVRRQGALMGMAVSRSPRVRARQI